MDTVDARARMSAWVRHTPLMHVDADAFAGDVWLKCEFMQHTGTFKARGAFNRILAAQERGEVNTAAGIVVGSGGNAGLAYAFAAARLGVAATVIVPETAPKNRVDRLLAVGATVVQREGIRSLLVSDDDIIAARRSVWDAWRIVIEHGAAAASSALSAGAYVPARGETVAVILCGSNTDPSTL